MPYILGGSFSNRQFSFESPMLFVAVAIWSEQESRLRGIRTKEEINGDPEFQKNLFDLSPIEKEITRYSKFILKSKVIKLTKKDSEKFGNSQSFIYDGYLQAIESLKLANPLLVAEGFKTCFLHVPIDKEARILPWDLNFFNHQLSKYPIKFLRHEEFVNILQLARLYVWLENLDTIRRKDTFVNNQLSENSNFEFNQFTKLVWNSPPIETYSNSFVGYPRMILKSNNDMRDQIIEPNNLQLQFFPVVRACLGADNGFLPGRCKLSSSRQPFGTFLKNNRFEKCWVCSQSSKGMDCISKRAKCDGKEIKCKDRQFANSVCQGDFCIYFTIYNDKLKVGRSIESRIIGRLIEQGAFDAMIFYSIPGLPFADCLEHKIMETLQKSLPTLGVSEIADVSERATSKEKYNHIISISQNPRAVQQRNKVYDAIVKVMNSMKTNEAIYLSSIERKKVCFEKNWIIDQETITKTLLIHNLRFHNIKGKVSGIAGPFLMIDEKAFDTSRMEGYVVGFPNQ